MHRFLFAQREILSVVRELTLNYFIYKLKHL